MAPAVSDEGNFISDMDAFGTAIARQNCGGLQATLNEAELAQQSLGIVENKGVAVTGDGSVTKFVTALQAIVEIEAK